MDNIKIGKFIAEKRKEQGLTQMQLAEKLSVTDRAVSKWENGKSMPDSAIMLALCEALIISVNDLLHGEVVSLENYNKEMEDKLIEMIKQKEDADKKLLSLEILIGIFSVIILLGFTLVPTFVDMTDGLRIAIIVVGFIISFIGIGFALRIEQTAGYYECEKCGHRYIPTFKSVLCAMHMGRTRYMKCPECKEKSWQKKVISKD